MNEMQFIEDILGILNKYPERYASDINWLNMRKGHWEKDRIRIGVVGVTSSGKSTLINAILGSKLLTEAVRPSSSQLVSCSYNDQTEMTVYFNDGKKKKIKGKALSQNTVKQYTDEKYNENNIEDVRQVELSTASFSLGKDILLIDSPGLDAYNMEHHEKLTLETLIPTIDVCIFVTTFKTNSDMKMQGFLNVIAKYKCPVIIVQNMYDSLKPSLDGLKSVSDVANDHKRRVEKIIADSDMKKEALYSIVQISAIEAMKGRCFNKSCNLRQYDDFVAVVKAIVERQKPKIIAHRIMNIREKITRLIREEQNFVDSNSNQLVSGFAFKNLDKFIEKSYKTTMKKIGNDISVLNGDSLIKNASGTKGFDEKAFNTFKSSVTFVEKSLNKQIIAFNDNIYKVLGRLNISRRDAVSYNGLPNVPEFSEITKEKVNTYRVEKSGFGNKVKRFFGGIFDADWGYETDTDVDIIFDEEATERSAQKHLKLVYKQYTKTLEKWEKSIVATLNTIDQVIENERASYDSRLKIVSDAQMISKHLKALNDVLSQHKVEYKKSTTQAKIKRSRKKEKIEKLRVDKSIYGIHHLAKKVIHNVNHLSMNYLLESIDGKKKQNVVITWDLNAYETFKHHYFENVKRNHTVLNFYNHTSLKFPTGKNGRNFFVLFNSIQAGSAKGHLVDSGLLKALRNNDNLILVVQDFNELINGEVVSEGLKEMQLIGEEFSFKNSCRYMINHENPIYNMAYINNQLSPCKTISEETEFLKYLQERLSMFVTPKAADVISGIIRSN